MVGIKGFRRLAGFVGVGSVMLYKIMKKKQIQNNTKTALVFIV